MIVKFPDSPYELHQPFQPAGDQPEAIEKLTEGLDDGLSFQTLLGVTGSGKTYTMANVIARSGRPALVLAPNKTLAAQLYSEFREFFPNNAVEYFVSYYDYYQPEAYVPSRDLYIEKDSSINEHIEQMRLSATKAILERPDCIIVATVSAIYGIGDPTEYHSMILHLRQGDRLTQRDAIKRLTEMQYQRTELDFRRGTFRVRGDVLDIFPAENAENAVRVSLFDDEVESLQLFDPLTGHLRHQMARFTVFPSSHYVTRTPEGARRDRRRSSSSSRAEGSVRRADEADRGAAHRAAHALRPRDDGRDRLLQGHRELLAPPVGAQARRAAADADRLPAGARADVRRREPRHHSAGRRHVQGRPRAQGEPGQLRLPPARRRSTTGRCASTNSSGCCRRRSSSRRRRPTTSSKHAGQVVEQVVRPTGLVDPVLDVRPGGDAGRRPAVGDQPARREERARAGDDAHQAHGRGPHRLSRRARRARCATCTRDIDTVERVEIIRDLRLGEFDVLVGINLLREGLDIPEVSLVAILDADKEGLPARRALADPDDRPRGAAHQRQGDPLRRPDDRLDEGGDRRDRAAAREAGRVQPRDGHHAEGRREAHQGHDRRRLRHRRGAQGAEGGAGRRRSTRRCRRRISRRNCGRSRSRCSTRRRTSSSSAPPSCATGSTSCARRCSASRCRRRHNPVSEVDHSICMPSRSQHGTRQSGGASSPVPRAASAGRSRSASRAPARAS